MDTLKAKISPVDQPGYLTTNEAKDLVLFLYNDDTAETINAGSPTWETSIPAEDGGTLLLANAAHTVNDDGNTPTLQGKLTLAITLAQMKRIKRGRNIPFHVKRTVSSTVRTYWGFIDEVREAII